MINVFIIILDSLLSPGFNCSLGRGREKVKTVFTRKALYSKINTKHDRGFTLGLNLANSSNSGVSVPSSYSVIVRVSVVLKRTVVYD